jgi:hypothetical protein
VTVARAAQLLISFSLYDSSTGLLKSGSAPAATVSKDAGDYAASTNAVAEIQTSGTYTLTLTATEMTASLVTIKITAAGALSVTVNIETDTVAAGVTAVPTAVQNADALLTRPISSVEGGSHPFRTLYGMIAKLVNKTSISGNSLIITETNDSTQVATQSLGRDATATPVVSVDTD